MGIRNPSRNHLVYDAKGEEVSELERALNLFLAREIPKAFENVKHIGSVGSNAETELIFRFDEYGVIHITIDVDKNESCSNESEIYLPWAHCGRVGNHDNHQWPKEKPKYNCTGDPV